MAARVVEIEVHLSCVGVRELPEFEIDDHETPEAPVEEEQVDPVPLVADAESSLASDEGEVATQFQQEGLEVRNEGGLEFWL